MKVGVLVSGGGTDLQSIIDAGINVVKVISSKEGVFALERAAKAGIEAMAVTKKQYPKIADRMTVIADEMEKAGAELIVLAGYLEIVTSELLDRFPGSVINIHPALLPKFGGPGFYGLNVHKAVLAADEKESGATVHFVNEGVDKGPIIAQRSVPVMEGDTPESLQERVLEVEHELLPQTILSLEKQRSEERKLK
ncbi:MAG: phosphoribosylglycinamide formyltransferase [Clostridia bacterium]|nr:phosphoribosylglycinamide formyltransferase [Clostridia bacterium]